MSKNAIHLLSPANGATVCQTTPEQVQFSGLNISQNGEKTLDWLNLIHAEKTDHTFPCPILCRWQGILRNAVVRCAEDMSFQTGRLDFAAADELTDAICIHSLKANTRYFWCVTGEDAEDGHPVSSVTSSFITADTVPRWIAIDGATNVRDCGGWTNRDGRRVRQGLLFRGSEMNNHMAITPKGVDFMVNQLKIRTILDMRTKWERDASKTGGPALPPSVLWINIPLRPYEEIFGEAIHNEYGRAFRMLRKENFPLYFHCWGGADRTGTFALLIGALLGIEDERLYQDYELTSLSVWGERSRKREYFQKFLELFLPLAPDGTHETRARIFFRQCGITDMEINDFRNLMLE